MKCKKVATAVLFTLALTVPTTLGIPLTFSTFSTVQEAEARTLQSRAQLRQMRISYGRFFITQNGPRATGRATAADWRTNFVIVPANRSSVTLTAVRNNNSNRAQIRFRTGDNQWTRWSRTNTSRRVSVPANNGIENRHVRLRVQLRSEDGRKTTTYNYIIRRASTNTRAESLTATGGVLTPSFHRNTTNYRIDLPWGVVNQTSTVRLSLRASHSRANVVWDSKSISRDRSIWSFSNFPRSNRWQVRRTASTHDFVRVAFGETTRVRFRIMGAYNTMVSGPNNTRTYTVTIHRGPTSYQQILDYFIPLIQTSPNKAHLNGLHTDASSALVAFQSSGSGTRALSVTRQGYMHQIQTAFDERSAQLP